MARRRRRSGAAVSTTATPGSGLRATGIAPTIVNMSAVQDLLAKPQCAGSTTAGRRLCGGADQTLGNNVLAYLDRTGSADVNVYRDTDAASVLGGNGRPTGNPTPMAAIAISLVLRRGDFQTNFYRPPQGVIRSWTDPATRQRRQKRRHAGKIDRIAAAVSSPTCSP